MQVELLAAIKVKVDALALSMSLPVWWENVSEDSDGASQPTGTHLRVSLIYTDPENLIVCGSGSRYKWILQISVYVRDGVGAVVPITHAEALCAGMPKNTNLSNGGFVFRTETDGNIISLVGSNQGWAFVPVQFVIGIIN